ncbi:DUF4911 domain-containing protein [Anaeroselena agilis]|uniref:DUF4911 domain-containing protein n=1 Tax=Anaeroselena agilis TaxID=3063788 RepID=A0ABU3NW58_9FIRM|nr:DUF4911 domain-containing protein [Selenomonadales bacterium 4137-cl]
MFDAGTIYIRVEPRDVNFVNRIMEGHEYLGVVTTVDKARGILAVRATTDTAAAARAILGRLPVLVEFLEKPE